MKLFDRLDAHAKRPGRIRPRKSGRIEGLRQAKDRSDRIAILHSPFVGTPEA
jgi:hypothetical protein